MTDDGNKTTVWGNRGERSLFSRAVVFLPLTSTILRTACRPWLRMAGRAKDGVLRSRRSREGGLQASNANEYASLSD